MNNFTKQLKFAAVALAIVLGTLSVTGCETPTDSPKSTVVTMNWIYGIAPVVGETPVTRIAGYEQYSGTVTWDSSPHTDSVTVFAAFTQYIATITLTAKAGYTLNGVKANFFVVDGAIRVSNNANSGVITAVFPETDKRETPTAADFEYYWVNQHGSLVTTSGGAITILAGATLTITAQAGGYYTKQWHLDGFNTGQSGNTYNFSSMEIGKHTVGLLVEKDGKLYNTNITVTVLEQEE